MPLNYANLKVGSTQATVPTKEVTDFIASGFIEITLTAAGWADKKQTVTATGVLEDETAQVVTPIPKKGNDTVYYINAGIVCVDSAADSLTFQYTSGEAPTEDIGLYVLLQNILKTSTT